MSGSASGLIDIIHKMNSGPSSKGESSLIVLAFLSLAIGILSGVLVALFRLALTFSDRLRGELILWAHPLGYAGMFLIVGMVAVAAAIAAWLVRKFSPHTSGSGIPVVEEAIKDEFTFQGSAHVLSVKFVGGVLAIGSGLALGREGPSVHMGARIAGLIGQLFRCNAEDRKALAAAGAGAGLATAFNAPVAGAVFVLEELVGKFSMRMTIASLGASVGAIAVARI